MDSCEWKVVVGFYVCEKLQKENEFRFDRAPILNRIKSTLYPPSLLPTQHPSFLFPQKAAHIKIPIPFQTP